MTCHVCKQINQAITMLNALGDVELDAEAKRKLVNADGSPNTERYGDLVLIALAGLRRFCASANLDFDALMNGADVHVRDDLAKGSPS